MCICALQALPGCEFYTLTNLNLWLQTHQYNNKPYRDKNDKNEAPRNSSAYCYPPSIRFKPQTNSSTRQFPFAHPRHARTARCSPLA